jgi:hypothetical protein
MHVTVIKYIQNFIQPSPLKINAKCDEITTHHKYGFRCNTEAINHTLCIIQIKKKNNAFGSISAIYRLQEGVWFS